MMAFSHIKFMNVKEIYYNNKTYSVPMSTLRHINKTDVVRLDDNTIVFYSDGEQQWKLADVELETLYENLVVINVKTESEVIPLKVGTDNIIEILNKKIAKVKLDAIVICVDEQTNTWTILNKDDQYYKLFVIFDKNKGRMNIENNVVNGMV